MPTHTSLRRTLLLSLLALALLSAPAYAFLDEVAQLKEELQTYQTTHTTATFSDLVARLDDIAGPAFKDVTEGQWFHTYISAVADWGIVSGYTDERGNKTGMFGPANPVTIAEAMKMAFKAAKVDGKLCKPQVETAQAIGHWAERFIACAEQVNMRVLRKNAIDINRPARRAEVLAIVDDAFGEHVPALYASFLDTEGHLYEADVAYAVVRGVVNGDTDAQGRSTGTFRPNGAINRAEIAKIIYEQLKARVRLQTRAQQS